VGEVLACRTRKFEKKANQKIGLGEERADVVCLVVLCMPIKPELISLLSMKMDY
jgi:hypothetical protein